MSAKILIFGGTTEGRLLAEALSRAGREAEVCTATAYGGKLLEGLPHIGLRTGRLDAAAMLRLMESGAYELAIDATHPYASEVSKNIREAASACALRYLRVLRQPGETGRTAGSVAADNRQEPAQALSKGSEENKNLTGMDKCPGAGSEFLSQDSHGVRDEPPQAVIVLPDMAAAATYLAGTIGNILLTTGSKELNAFQQIPGFTERVFARVLPDADSLNRCRKCGLSGSRIIAMQGPFSHELNLALLRHAEARYLVTKDGGSPGGLEDKMSAALEAGVQVVLLARPPEENGFSLAETLYALGL